jgi:hypothetical protein
MLVGEMPDSELPQWLDKADVGTVGVLTLDDGERMTAQVVGFDEERDELVVDVISPKAPIGTAVRMVTPFRSAALFHSSPNRTRRNRGHTPIPAGVVPSRVHALL